MGDSITLKCTVCKSEYPKRKFPFFFIGRGIESKVNLLPAYCAGCKKFTVSTAENNNCEVCKTKVQLLGEFEIVSKKQFIPMTTPSYFWYDWDLLNTGALDLTINKLISKSNMLILNKDLYCLVFKTGFNKFLT